MPDTAVVRIVNVIGVPEKLLWGVKVRCDDQVVFDLTAVSDGRGGSVTAGEMIASIASLDDLHGIAIMLPRQDIPVAALQVDLYLLGEPPRCAVTYQ